MATYDGDVYGTADYNNNVYPRPEDGYNNNQRNYDGQMNSSTPTAIYPRYPPNNNYHGVDIDTATIVSIASSCIILISGCIAVVCLIMYMRKTDMMYRSRTCAKCGAHVMRGRELVGTADESGGCSGNMQMPHGQEVLANLAAQTSGLTYQIAIEPNTPGAKSMGQIAILQAISTGDNLNRLEKDTINETMQTPFKNAAAQRRPDNYFEDEDEAAPYATFNLSGFDNDLKVSDSYETFTAKFSEPPYMLLKKGLESGAPPQPQYGETSNYRLRLVVDKLGGEESLYQSAGLSQCHSITSCSSNHTELIRAYEFDKQQKQKLIKLQNEFIECLEENDTDDTFYNTISIDKESPTDPGIREFTKSPPRPNEKRLGGAFHQHQPVTSELLELAKQISIPGISSKTGSEEEESGKNDSSPIETSNSLSSIHASSTTNDETSEASNEEEEEGTSSASTPTIDAIAKEMDEDNLMRTNFGAIPRDRSRHPSWASFTTMKSNTTLTTSQYNESDAEPAADNKPSREGITSDDDDDERPSPAPPVSDKSLYSTNRMFGYVGNPTESIMSSGEEDAANKTSSSPPPPGPAPQRAAPQSSSTRLVFDNSKRFY